MIPNLFGKNGSTDSEILKKQNASFWDRVSQSAVVGKKSLQGFDWLLFENLIVI